MHQCLNIWQHILNEETPELEIENEAPVWKDDWSFDWPAFTYRHNLAKYSVFIGSTMPGVELTRYNFPCKVIGCGVIPLPGNSSCFSCFGVLALDCNRREAVVYILGSKTPHVKNVDLPRSNWKVRKVKLCAQAFDLLARIQSKPTKIAFEDRLTAEKIRLVVQTEDKLLCLGTKGALEINKEREDNF